jgi:transcriptional regulator with XRE-family HTH domain
LPYFSFNRQIHVTIRPSLHKEFPRRDCTMPFHFTTAHEIAQTLAQRLKVARLAQGLTQAELATRAGVSVGTIRNLERDGDCAFATVIKVAQSLRLEDGFEALFAPGVQSIAELARLEDAKSKVRQRAPRKPRTPKAAP